jgi:hypothetical protein
MPSLPAPLEVRGWSPGSSTTGTCATAHRQAVHRRAADAHNCPGQAEPDGRARRQPGCPADPDPAAPVADSADHCGRPSAASSNRANSTHHTVSSRPSSTPAAACNARRVFPHPPVADLFFLGPGRLRRASLVAAMSAGRPCWCQVGDSQPMRRDGRIVVVSSGRARCRLESLRCVGYPSFAVYRPRSVAGILSLQHISNRACRFP